MRRVVVTGLGVYTSYGLGTKALWENLINNTSVVEKIPERWRTKSNAGFYAPLPKLDYAQLGFSRSETLQYEPVTLHALLSVEEAMKQANFEITKMGDKLNRYILSEEVSEKIGVFAGTGIGGIETLSNATDALKRTQQGERVRQDALSVAKTMPYNIAAAIGIKWGLHQHINSHTYACATGTILIGKAMKEIQNGSLDVAITCSSEYADQEIGLLYNAFFNGGTLTKGETSTQVNMPFDTKRSGFLFSEGGSGALVLESLEHAQARGATILAEIVGFSDSFDGFNMVSPDTSGVHIEKMLRDLLCQANIQAEDVSYINAHGTATLKNDAVETMVLEKIFNQQTAINSTKSFLGHSISASGSIEAVTTILSMQHGMVHSNYGLSDPISDLHLVRENTAVKIDYALSESFAFGGHNGALLFKAYNA